MFNVNGLGQKEKAELTELLKDRNIQLNSQHVSATVIFSQFDQLLTLENRTAMQIHWLQDMLATTGRIEPIGRISMFQHLKGYTAIITGFGKQRELKKLYKDVLEAMGAEVVQVQRVESLIELLGKQKTIIFVYQPHLLLRLLSQLNSQQQASLCVKLRSLRFINELCSRAKLSKQTVDELLNETPEFWLSAFENTTVGCPQRFPIEVRANFKQFHSGPNPFLRVRVFRQPDAKMSSEAQLEANLGLRESFWSLRGYSTALETYNLTFPKRLRQHRYDYQQKEFNTASAPLGTPWGLFRAFPAPILLLHEGEESSLKMHTMLTDFARSRPEAQRKLAEFLQIVRFVPFSKATDLHEARQRTVCIYQGGRQLQEIVDSGIAIRSPFWLALIFLQYCKPQARIVKPAQNQGAPMSQTTQTVGCPFAPELASPVAKFICSGLHNYLNQLQMQQYNLDAPKLLESFVDRQQLREDEFGLLTTRLAETLCLTPVSEPLEPESFEALFTLIKQCKYNIGQVKEQLKPFETSRELPDIPDAFLKQEFESPGSRLNFSFTNKDFGEEPEDLAFGVQ